jgi:hypothetical protein
LAKYPSNLVAAVINISNFSINLDNSVYSTTYAAYLLSLLTILNSGSAVYLVNDRDFLIPNSF